LGAIAPFKVLQSHLVWYQSKAHKLCNFLLVINANLSSILQNFRDVAFNRSKITILGYTSCVLPTTEGFPWDDLRKIYLDVNGWARYQTA